MPQLSIIVPVFNEAKDIREVMERINSAPIDKEVIAVDDGSSDGTGRILREIKYHNLKVIHHSSRRGKGAAFLTGLANASGEFVVKQGADFGQEPVDYLGLIGAIKENKADMVLGTSFKGSGFPTLLINALFKAKLKGYRACYKLAAKKTWDNLNLRACGLEIDAEILSKALKMKLALLEVPVSCAASHAGTLNIFWLLKYRFTG